jgi:pimeloyl-ACP methyl ester carboxylesterase
LSRQSTGESGRFTVTSFDGTPIAVWRSGEGSPLLLIHGGTADHTTTWRSVLPQLERRFTIYAMDRRGRGGSGDSAAYDLTREAEDVSAVVDHIGDDVSVVGHSYGALCAIESTLLTRNIRRLVLYEGVYLSGSDIYKPGMIDRLVAMLDAGDVEDMLVTVFRELVEMPDEDLDLLRSQKDAWAIRVANAPTLPREMKADEAYVFVPDRFTEMRAPTMFLVGGDSPKRELENATRIADHLPNAQVSVLPGQQHAAMHTAPDVFVNELVRFLSWTSS